MAMQFDPAAQVCFSCSSAADSPVAAVQSAWTAASMPQQEIVFIDASLAMRLIEQYPTGEQQDQQSSSRSFILLELDRNGMYQISDALVDRSNITDLHLVVPGVPAELRFGNAILNLDTIDFYQYEFPIWDSALAADAEIWIHRDISVQSDRRQSDRRQSDSAASDSSSETVWRCDQALMQRLSQQVQRRVYLSDRRF